MIEQHADARLVVNATPRRHVSRKRRLAARTCGGCRSAGACWTLCINPARTALLQQAEQLGLRAENGPFHAGGAGPLRGGAVFCSGPIDPARTAIITDTLQKRMRDLILIGMPARARRPSAACWRSGWAATFSDADEELERRFGCDIRHFSRARARLPSAQRRRPCGPSWASAPAAIIATGGGCVTRPENEPLLRQNAAVIWLQRALDRLPVAGRPVSRRTTPEALYAQRAAAYAAFSDGTADNNGNAGRDRPANSGGMDMNILVLNGPNSTCWACASRSFTAARTMPPSSASSARRHRRPGPQSRSGRAILRASL